MTDDAATTDEEHPYWMRLSLNVLDHLGLNLYSNIPAVLSEVVAKSWDADAPTVTIEIDTAAKKITVTDTGVGMTADDLNDRFLFRRVSAPREGADHHGKGPSRDGSQRDREAVPVRHRQDGAAQDRQRRRAVPQSCHKGR